MNYLGKAQGILMMMPAIRDEVSLLALRIQVRRILFATNPSEVECIHVLHVIIVIVEFHIQGRNIAIVTTSFHFS